jgi:hypothetical protein
MALLQAIADATFGSGRTGMILIRVTICVNPKNEMTS